MWLQFRVANLLQYKEKLLMFLGDMDLRESLNFSQVSKHAQALIHVPVVCCTVEPSFKGHFITSIVTVSFTHTILSHKPYKWNFTAQKGKCDREKRTSDRARTRDLRSIAEFQPREPRRPAEIPRPPSPLCTGHRCAAIQRRLRPAPRGWYCVLCDGSRLSGV